MTILEMFSRSSLILRDNSNHSVTKSVHQPALIISQQNRRRTQMSERPTASREKAKPCYRCSRKHDARLCKFKDAICHRCGKLGHIFLACKTVSPPPVDTRKRNYRPYHKKRPDTSNQWLDVEDTDNKLPMFILSGEVPQPPIMINMILDRLPVDFELDTGAAVTVVSEEGRSWSTFPWTPT